MASRRPQVAFVFLFALLLLPTLACAEENNLADLDIEDLMQVEVVTASRRPEPLAQVAGAVTVLDEEDIFRSGATTLPEVLKLVPGVHVAQMDMDKWAVGIRGFNGLLSNKHLVLIDGRPATSPTMGGMAWGNSFPISMIKRVEVVRGTWTSLWGADSFTGVINIITKSAADTQGGQSVTQVGSRGAEQTVRYGGELGETGHYRAYVNGGYKSGNWLSGNGGQRGSKDWLTKQFGFRTDWENAYTDALSFQGNLINSSINDGAAATMHVFDPKKREEYSGYGQFVWDRATGLDAGVKFRTSFSRDSLTVDDLSGGTNTLDAELQYAMEQADIHRLTWGLGSRYFWDDLKSGDNTSIERERRYTITTNGFVQDRITLVQDSVYLILGTKLDYLGHAPLEIQPTIRVLHTGNNEEYWLAVSRAVRAGNKFQRSGSYSINHRGKTYTVNVPDRLSTEKLISYEAGYRRTLSEKARLDVNLYVNDYDELIMLEFDDATSTATLHNSLKGTSYGLETLVDWDVLDWLSLRPSISVIHQNIYGLESAPIGDSMPEEGLGVELKLQVLTSPAEGVGFDVFMAYLDSPDQRGLPGYVSLEAHASWQATESVMLELIGRNLSEATEQFSSLRVGPSLDLRMTWDF